MSPAFNPSTPDQIAQKKIADLKERLAQARQALRVNQQALARSDSALRAMADGVTVTDCSGRIVIFNDIAAHLTGWPQADALGRRLIEVVQFINGQGGAVDVLAQGFSDKHEEIVSLVRRDEHVILVDGTVAQIRDREQQAIGHVIAFRNVTAATRLTRELSFQANHDPLTGLLNRRAFDADLLRAISSANESGLSHALLYFDLDHFKAVNDSGGHVAGDELLRHLATVLRKQLREHDTLARLGGDEFAVLLENCTATHAARVAEKIRKAIADCAFAWENRNYQVSASIGLVLFADADLSPEELLAAVDRLCYVAKTAGRNRVMSEKVDGESAKVGSQNVSDRTDARRSSEPASIATNVRAMRAIR